MATKKCACGHPWELHTKVGCLFVTKTHATILSGVWYVTHREFCGCANRRGT